MNTLQNALSYLARYLNKYESEYICLKVLKMNLNKRYQLYSQSNKMLNQNECILIENYLRARLQTIPLEYLFSQTSFYGLEFYINSNCLIPRMESELLVDKAIEIIDSRAAKRQKTRCLDLGTGSGALIAAIKHNRPEIEAFATDLSSSSLRVSKKNFTDLNLDIFLTQCFWGEAFLPSSFDIIIANPPYVAFHELQYMSAGTVFEPFEALFSNQNGLADIEAVVHTTSKMLKTNGVLLLEHGFKQGKLVRDMLSRAGYQAIQTINDFNGLPRICLASMSTTC